jgi:hypothetical protein
MSEEARDLLKQLLAEIASNGNAPTRRRCRAAGRRRAAPVDLEPPAGAGEVVGEDSRASERPLPATPRWRLVQSVLARGDEIRAARSPHARPRRGPRRRARHRGADGADRQAGGRRRAAVVAPRAGQPPLAREKARALGVEINGAVMLSDGDRIGVVDAAAGGAAERRTVEAGVTGRR